MNDCSTPQWRTLPALLERINAGAATPTFTMDGLRWLVRNASQNGLDEHIRRPAGGRKLLINEAGFLRWLESQPSRRSAA